MKILAYQGISWVSKVIRWQTRSKYSHVAILTPESTVIEAWFRGGVQENESFRTVHTPGTVVDVFDVPIAYPDLALAYARLQIGKEYDWWGVARFVLRTGSPDDRNRWWCSELAMEVCDVGGTRLLGIPSWKASPRDVAASPLLAWADQWVV